MAYFSTEENWDKEISRYFLTKGISKETLESVRQFNSFNVIDWNSDNPEKILCPLRFIDKVVNAFLKNISRLDLTEKKEFVNTFKEHTVKHLFLGGANLPLFTSRVKDFQHLAELFRDQHPSHQFALYGELYSTIVRLGSEIYGNSSTIFPTSGTTKSFYGAFDEVASTTKNNFKFIIPYTPYLPMYHHATKNHKEQTELLIFSPTYDDLLIQAELLKYLQTNDIKTPTIVLLTSISRVGQHVDVNSIIKKIHQSFPEISFWVDASQDSRPFPEADLTFYSKRIGGTGCGINILRKNCKFENELKSVFAINSGYSTSNLAIICSMLETMKSKKVFGIKELWYSSIRWESVDFSSDITLVFKSTLEETLKEGRNYFNGSKLLTEIFQLEITDIDLPYRIICLRPRHDQIIDLALIHKKMTDKQVIFSSFAYEDLSLLLNNVESVVDRNHIIASIKTYENENDGNLVSLLLPPHNVIDCYSNEQIVEFLRNSIQFHQVYRLFIGEQSWRGKLLIFLKLLEETIQSHYSMKSDQAN